jgi:hypothetical protein
MKTDVCCNENLAQDIDDISESSPLAKLDLALSDQLATTLLALCTSCSNTPTIISRGTFS